MFYDQARAVIYLKSHSLELYLPKIEQAIEIDFPPDVFNYLEIQNLDYFRRILINFLQKNLAPKTEVILLLSSLSTFNKKLTKISSAQDEIEINRFFASVPFKNEDIIRKVFSSGNQISLISANRNTLMQLNQLFIELRVKVVTILPISVIAETPENQALSGSLIKQWKKELPKFKYADLAPDLANQKTTNASNNAHSSLLIIVLVLVFILAAIGSFFMLKMVNSSQ